MDYLFVFDVGGVIVRGFSVWNKIKDTMGLHSIEMERGLPKDGTKAWDMFQDMHRGKISSMDFLYYIAEEEGVEEPKENYWTSFFSPILDTDTEDFINTLQSKGFRVVAGTNTLKEHYDYHIEKGEYKSFSKVYASHLMGEAKPDSSFWQYILDEENKLRIESGKDSFTFEQMIFFDDMKENIDAALSLGVKAILFTDAKKALQDLNLLGISV